MIAHGDGLDQLLDLWNRLFHHPELPLGLAIFRILFGLLLSAESFGLIKRGHELFSNQALAPVEARLPLRFAPFDSQCNIFLLFRNTDAWIRVVFVVHTVSCALLTVGLFTRVAALLIFLNFASRSKQNWYVVQGGDNIAKLMTFLMIFSNAGGALSLDSFLGLRWVGGATGESSQWAQRLMQIQVSIVYLRTVMWKLKAREWIDGTAVFHAVYRNPHFRWRSLPGWMEWGPVIAGMTWGTMLIETAAGTLVWFRETRYVTILAGTIFHATLEVFLKLKFFQYLSFLCLLLFVPNDAWIGLWGGVKMFFLHFVH
jgi:uncharacterized membrane protein YphA (DoxX/SURF4 family)